MTAETEVSMNVVAVFEEVKGLGISDFQDLRNMDCCGINSHNEVGDSDNLQLNVTGANGFDDYPVGDKEEGVFVVEDSVDESNAVFEVLNRNLDVDNGNGKVSDFLEEGGDGNEEADSPVVNCLSLDQEMSHEDSCLIVGAVADSLDPSEKTESRVEAEIKHVDDLNGTLEKMEGDETEMPGDQDVNFEGLTSNEHVNVEDLINSESNPALVENSESQVEAARLVLESKQEESDNVNVGCDGQVELCQESSDGAVNDVVDKLQEVNVEGHKEAYAEIAEEDEVPLEASSDSDLEYSINNKEESIEEKRELNNLITCKNESDITNETGSPHVLVDGVECELQKASSEGLNEAIIEVEAAEHEVLDTSIDSDSEPYPINKNEEAFQEEPKTTLDLDVMENQECNTEPINRVQDGLDLMNEEKTTDPNLESLSHLVLEENNNVNLSVSEVEDSVQDHEEPKKHPHFNVISPVIMLSDIEASVQTQSLPASYVHEPRSEIDMHVAETIGTISSSPADSSKPEIVANDISGHESHVTIQFGSIVCCNEKEPTFLGGDGLLETGISNGKPEVVNSPTIKVKTDHFEVHAFSATNSKYMTDDGIVMCETNGSDSVDVNNESSNILLEIVDAKDKRDQLNGTDENLLLQETEGIQNFQNDSLSLASLEGSSNDEKAVTKPFNYLMKIPRYDDENLKKEIRLAKLQLDEKTKSRDAIQAQIREQRRVNSQVHSVDYKHAKDEYRNARNLVRSKRMEIDSLQSMINKANNATTVEDTSRRINDMECRIQHETISLKEEKRLIREIQQQKQLRKQLSSDMVSQDDIKRAVEQKEQFEEKLKDLRKEVDILKQNASKAEAATVESERKFDGERKKVQELQAQFKAANDLCQEAYLQWQSLRMELSQKYKLFYEYKKDASVAKKYAFRKDTERLYRYCQNHMQEFIELWNTNVEFRNEYMRLNARSTLRRLGNLDGRLLGPNEDPPTPPSSVDKIVSTKPSKVDPISQNSPELKQEIPIKNGISEDKSIKKVTQLKQETPIKNGISEDISMKKVTQLKQETNIKNGSSEDKSMKKVTQRKKHVSKTKGPAKPIKSNGVATFSDTDVTEEVHKEPTKSTEKIELERKAEEIRKKEAEAKLKKQRRLEELTKAKEAFERKKRQADREQKRAELKAQKEAEQKEKNREKRLRKKEIIASDTNNNDDSAPITENSIETVEIEANDISSVKTENPKKPKQKKKSAVPLPICNPNKKKWQRYAWTGVGVAGLLVLVLLWLVYPEEVFFS